MKLVAIGASAGGRKALSEVFEAPFQNVGVLMSGRLSDSTAGLEAIKMCGGIAIVQDPATAEFGDMPSYAVQTVDVDAVADLRNLPAVGRACDPFAGTHNSKNATAAHT